VTPAPQERSRPLARHLKPACSHPRARLLLLAGLLSAFLPGAGPAGAQEPEVIRLPQQSVPAPPAATPEQTSRRAPVNVQEVLGELWFRRKGYLEKGDAASAERQVQLMRDMVRREGILSADDISGAFLLDGIRTLEAGNASRALQSLHLAKEFAPDRSGAYFAVARTFWTRERDFGGAISSYIDGIRINLRNPAARATVLGNFLLVLVTGSLLAAALWCLISALRTVRLAQHDLYEGRTRSLSGGAAQVAAWVLWLLPALLWLTGPWILAYWLALAFIYMRRWERVLSLAACACFLAALPVLGWITQESRMTTDPGVRFLLDSARGAGDPERIPVLEQMAAANPGEPLYRFLLAQSYHASGSTEAALQEYRQIQAENPRNASAWTNSGNIFLEQGLYQQAAEEYRRAIDADPKSALAFFNLHLALQAGLRLEEADAAFQEARKLDNNLVTSILSSEGGEGRREPAEARYGSEEILDLLQKKGEKSVGTLWKRNWLDPLPLAGGLGFLGCLVLGWGAERWGLGRAQRCVKCGQPFCRRCQVGMRREEGYCTACRHLYVLKDPVAPPVREERERLVASHERWQWISRRLVSLILPGTGQIQGGRTLIGAILLWATCLSVTGLMLSGRMLALSRVAMFDSPLWTRIVPATVIALAWLTCNTLSFEKRGRS